MKLSTKELYDLVYNSLVNTPEDWTYSDHHHTYRRGVGIPYTIENKEIGVTIWLANGAAFCNIKILSSVSISKNLPVITKEIEVGGINFFKKWKLFRASKRMVINKNSSPGMWEVPVSKKILRDNKLNKLLD